ncbi:MAG: hypothetical protein WDN67_01170 [Candidatus Moraniibacteriota bacterium]
MSPLVFLKTFHGPHGPLSHGGSGGGDFRLRLFSRDFLGSDPCPLCIAQRVFYFLIASRHFGSDRFFQAPDAPSDGLAYHGVRAPGRRHCCAPDLDAEHFPHENLDPTRCGVSFGSFFDSFLKALGGAATALSLTGKFIFSIAEWSLLLFIGFFFAGLCFCGGPSTRQSFLDLHPSWLTSIPTKVIFPLADYRVNGLPFGKRGEYDGGVVGASIWAEDCVVPAQGTDVRLSAAAG